MLSVSTRVFIARSPSAGPVAKTASGSEEIGEKWLKEKSPRSASVLALGGPHGRIGSEGFLGIKQSSQGRAPASGLGVIRGGRAIGEFRRAIGGRRCTAPS